MTLIATFSRPINLQKINKNIFDDEKEPFPLIFGDLLTVNEESGFLARIPTQGDVSDFFGEDGYYKISKLQQKVVIVGSNCALAWAGSWLAARVVICQFKELAEKGELTTENLLEILRTDEDVKKRGLQMAGWIKGDNYFDHFSYQTDHHANDFSNNFQIGGSGAESFINASQMKASFSGEKEPHDFDNIAYLLSVAGLLLQDEFYNGDATNTLRNFFGGGYEIAFYRNGRFRKLAEVTYILWTLTVEEEEKNICINAPQLFIKQFYKNDTLLIGSLRPRYNENNQINPTVISKYEQFFAVSPMYETDEPRKISIENFTYNSGIICSCFLYERNGREENRSLVHTCVSGNKNFVEFVNDGERGRLKISFDFFKSVEKLVFDDKND